MERIMVNLLNKELIRGLFAQRMQSLMVCMNLMGLLT